MNQKQKYGTRVALYARVSHSNGDQSPEPQLRALRAEAKLHCWTVVSEYVDRISSREKNRPKLQAMMWAANRHEFDMVACWKYDRIARDAIELLPIVDKLKALGIVFHSTEGIDTTTAEGYMMVTIMAAVAKQERERLTQRIRLGLAHAKKHGTRSGKPIGRPPGHEVDVKKVRRLYARVKSCRKVAEKFGISAMTVSRLVTKDKKAIREVRRIKFNPSSPGREPQDSRP